MKSRDHRARGEYTTERHPIEVYNDRKRAEQATLRPKLARAIVEHERAARLFNDFASGARSDDRRKRRRLGRKLHAAYVAVRSLRFRLDVAEYME